MGDGLGVLFVILAIAIAAWAMTKPKAKIRIKRPSRLTRYSTSTTLSIGQSLLSIDIGHRVLPIEKISLYVPTTSLLDLCHRETLHFCGLYQGFRLIVKFGPVVVEAKVANDFLYAIIHSIRDQPFFIFFSASVCRQRCNACFSIEWLRCQAFVTNAAAVFVHGGARTLATAANANGHFVSSDVLRRQNLNVGFGKHFSHSIIHPNAPKSKIATRDRTGFPANKMISESWKNFRAGS
ncbi:hypothetical protein [Rhizobium sp.]|uniref:hypothetical protein n=1 Tax=Rhizobium sp. TaxID=391 RepID=UPI0028AB8BC4